jgi:ATP-dependent phosphofructokinase / diphosphate-dependent phosphofructokinase
MRVGLLTGGGDCPGLNAVIRAVVQRIADEGWTSLGILEGWRGLVQNLTIPLDVSATDGIVGRGGTILGASRTNPYKNAESDVPAVMENFRALGLDALVVIGGDDTLGVAHRLHKDYNLPVIGVPKTIDNDLQVTDFTFGFDTAVNIVTEAVDRLRTTAESHRRIMVVETMGRNSGWIACFAGIATAADYILVPEVPIDLAHLVAVLTRRRAAGKPYGIVLASEGAEFPDRMPDDPHPPAARFGGIGSILAREIHDRTGFETRSVTLGHLQRGGAPSAYDRVLATRLGLAASHLVIQRRFGTLVALSRTQIVEKPLDDTVGAPRSLDLRYYDEAAAFFK